MRDILLTNRESVLATLQAYQASLAKLAKLLERADEGELTVWLQRAAEAHETYLAHKKEG